MAGNTRTGKISWFGGPNDSMSGPTTSSGRPVSQPAISLYDQSTKNGWWMVTMPNGVKAVVRQNDIGPAPWTGRVFDFTYTALPLLGYSEKTFPTDASITGTFIGKTLPADLAKLVGNKTLYVLKGGENVNTTGATATYGGAGATASTGAGTSGGLLPNFAEDIRKAIVYAALVSVGAWLAIAGLTQMFGPPPLPGVKASVDLADSLAKGKT